MITATAKFTKDDIGSYVNSANGIYMGEAVQEMAQEYGWKGNSVPCEDASGQHQCDEYDDAWTEAEDFLNTLTADDVYFGSSDQGDWGLWHICPDDSNDGLDCEFCENS